MLLLQPFCLLCLTWILLTHSVNPIWRAVGFCLLAFFTTALICHGEMARDRPPTRYLTEFYLWMSVGGVLGGLFNAIFAPLMFTWLVELPLALVFAALLRPKMAGGGWTDTFIGSSMPELAEWFNKVGDDIYSQFRSQPAAATSGNRAPAPVVHAPRGWFMGLTFDFLLPVLVTCLAGFLIFNGMGGWNWRGTNPKENSLFNFYLKSMGYKQQDAYTAAVNTSYFIMFGLPLVLALCMMSRPLRFGLALGGVLLVTYWQESSVERGRSWPPSAATSACCACARKKDRFGDYTYLMHGTTHHGLNYKPDITIDVFDAEGRPVPSRLGKGIEQRPLGRLATTYYHRLGPVGIVMEKMNWFDGQYGIVVKNDKGEVEKDANGNPKLKYEVNYLGTFNDYSSDARLPISLLGGISTDLIGGGFVPGLGLTTPLVAAWSEPSFATIGLGTGTMASYGRPYQHVVYYEIDEQIRSFSLKPDPYFTYVRDAINRGVKLEIVMGDARLSMNEERTQEDTTYTRPLTVDPGPPSSSPRRSPNASTTTAAIIVDAFSSDAIPVHLITKEAIEMYMSKLIKHRDPVLNPAEPYRKDAKGNSSWTVTAKRCRTTSGIRARPG